MSERGSFVTEYFYCPKCEAAAAAVLLGQEKYLSSIVIPYYSGGSAHIIAGKIGGLGDKDELRAMEFELIPELEKLICHPVRIAVLADAPEDREEEYSKIFIARPA